MKMVTFENAARQTRIGAIAPENRIVDLHIASALHIRDVEGAQAFYRLADALVPADMRALFRGGDSSLKAARQAFDHALLLGPKTTGPRGETLFYSVGDVKLRPRLFRRSSSIRREIFASIMRKRRRQDSRIR